MAYFWATRPIMGVFGFLLTLVSFRIQPHLSIPPGFDYTCATVVFVILCATMVHNDYVDGLHDLQKGKRTVTDNREAFLLYCIALWCIAAFCSSWLLLYNLEAFLLAIGMNILGLTYHWSYQIRGMALAVAACTSGLSTLFPLCLPDASIFTTCSAALVVLFLIAGREHCKDELDAAIDVDYKETLANLPDWPPLALATKRFFANVMFWLAAGALLYLHPLSPCSVLAALLIGSTTFAPKHWQRLLDPAMALLLVAGLTNFAL